MLIVISIIKNLFCIISQRKLWRISVALIATTLIIHRSDIMKLAHEGVFKVIDTRFLSIDESHAPAD